MDKNSYWRLYVCPLSTKSNLPKIWGEKASQSDISDKETHAWEAQRYSVSTSVLWTQKSGKDIC